MIKNDNAIIFQTVKPNQCCDTCMLMFPAQLNYAKGSFLVLA